MDRSEKPWDRSASEIAPDVGFPTFSELEALVAGGNLQIVETKDLHQTPSNCFIVAKKIEGLVRAG